MGANTAQARQAFTSWMGPGGVFAGGSSLLELHAAIVIGSVLVVGSRRRRRGLRGRYRPPPVS